MADPRLTATAHAQIALLTPPDAGDFLNGVADTLFELMKTMQAVMQVLGPQSVCQCAGCAYETDEAIRLLREAGIEYQQRKLRPEAPPHDPEAEARGNEIADVIEVDPYYDKLIDIMERLDALVEETATVSTEGVDPTYAATAEGQVSMAQLASFDAGHLQGASTIILAAINPDYSGLKRYRERDSERRLQRVVLELHG